MLFKRRIDEKLERFGEDFTIDSNTYKGFIQQLDMGRARVYLDDTEMAGLVRPGLFIVTSATASISPNQTMVRDGVTYTVRKTSKQRLGNTVMVQFVLLSE